MARTLISRCTSLLFSNFFCGFVEGEVRGFVALWRSPGKPFVDLLPKILRPLSTTALSNLEFCKGALERRRMVAEGMAADGVKIKLVLVARDGPDAEGGRAGNDEG